MTEANYRLGASTTLDVLDAQAALTQAEFTRIEALHAHVNARAGLRYVMGQEPLGETAPRPAPAGPPLTMQASDPAGGTPADPRPGR